MEGSRYRNRRSKVLPVGRLTVISTDDSACRKLYLLMISGIIPRPIAFVSSMSGDGKHNLAPFRCVGFLPVY